MKLKIKETGVVLAFIIVCVFTFILNRKIFMFILNRKVKK